MSYFDLWFLFLLFFNSSNFLFSKFLKHKWHVSVKNFVFVMLKIYHVYDFIVKFFGQEDIHELLPSYIARFFCLFPSSFFSKHEFSFNGSFQFCIIFIIIKELLQIIIFSNFEEVAFSDFVRAQGSPIKLLILNNIFLIVFCLQFLIISFFLMSNIRTFFWQLMVIWFIFLFSFRFWSHILFILSINF